jgi:hypothetical protein
MRWLPEQDQSAAMAGAARTSAEKTTIHFFICSFPPRFELNAEYMVVPPAPSCA